MLSIPEIKLSLVLEGTTDELVQVTCSQDLYDAVLPMFDVHTIDYIEEMILVCLNRANRIIGFFKVSKGGQTGTVCDPKVVFSIALNCGACSIALAHNHPSGNLKPSQADLKLTQKVKAAGKLLDIVLMDHLIVTRAGYHGMADYREL
ncbi:JAB domain-containing protein [bacterium]|nr:JAB domain-containing protein [bacterium]